MVTHDKREKLSKINEENSKLLAIDNTVSLVVGAAAQDNCFTITYIQHELGLPPVRF